MKKYQIIYADPPWAYNESGSGNRVVSSKYPTMQIDDIEKLPIRYITDSNCILWLWVTFPRLQEGIRLMSSWGFKYKGLGFIWVKMNKSSFGFFYGMGYYTRQNPEICLIGRIGRILTLRHDISCVYQSVIQEHSKKPSAIRSLIVDICGDLPRIELFARQKVEGWDCWGNEVESDIELESRK